MEKQFVDYEIALKLKELNFEEKCIAWYLTDTPKENKHFPILGSYQCNWNYWDRINAPLWQQVTTWFREKYSLYITITSQSQESWQWHIQFPHDSLDKFWEEDYTSYEEALEEAVLQALKRIENEENRS